MIREGSAVPVDDLNAPLGQDIGKSPAAATSITSIPWVLVAGVLGVIVLGAAMAKLLLIRPADPKVVAPAVMAGPESARPERMKSIPEKSPPESAGTNIPPAAAVPEADKPASPATQTITIIDGRSGKREQVVIPVTPGPNR